jgi:Dyp-type peroxidase family
MKKGEIDFADVQGLVRFGYGKMTKARYELLRIKDAAAARTWLRSAPVTNSTYLEPPPKTALNVALTAPGLEALGVSGSVIEGFSHEFRTGMSRDYRARQLGDVGRNAPEYWDWGNTNSVPHVLVMFFAEPEHFDAHVQTAIGTLWNEAFEVMRSLGTGDLDGIEPFGFVDGISQPTIDWEQRRETPTTQWEYSDVVALGEFLLGYPNEYGKLTERPLLEPDPGNSTLPHAVDQPEKKDLGRNGTYLVMRQLSQDVRKFWQFNYQQSAGDPAEAEKLAALMVGRRRNGDPLVEPQSLPIPGIGRDPFKIRQNGFTFNKDASGSRCPFGAHVRRANPRNADFPEPPSSLLKKLLTILGLDSRRFREDVTSSVRFHRILRRGREYGEELKPEDALSPVSAEEQERGLHFICLNANIGRQFEFLQNAWIASSKFSALTGETDPLLGNREPIPGCPVTSDFNIPREGRLRRRISDVPQFVTVRGGAYFFLPGLSALRYFAMG